MTLLIDNGSMNYLINPTNAEKYYAVYIPVNDTN